MSKKQIPNLDRDLIAGAFRQETGKKRPIVEAAKELPAIPDEKPKEAPGRKADFPGEKTKRVTVTITLDAWKALRIALATTHEGKTQNRLINDVILNTLGPKNEE